MEAQVKRVFRLMLAASQWRNEYDEFAGLRKDGKPRAKRHLIAGNYFLRWAHLGDFETMAPSPRKAVSNLRWRLFHGSAAAARFVAGWTVKEAA